MGVNYHIILYTFTKHRMQYPISRQELDIADYEIPSLFFNNKLISVAYLNGSLIIKVWEY